ASTEPSVHAGYDGDPNYLIHTNLIGAANCLEHVRRYDAGLIFLSSSRVYPIAPLRALPLVQTETRFVLSPTAGFVPRVAPQRASMGRSPLAGGIKMTTGSPRAGSSSAVIRNPFFGWREMLAAGARFDDSASLRSRSRHQA